MKWTNDSDKTEEAFVAEHSSYMGKAPEVITYLQMRHRKIMGKATNSEVQEAYQRIPIQLKQEWQAARARL